MKSSNILRRLAIASLGFLAIGALAQESQQAVVLYASDFPSLGDGDFPSDLVFRGGGMQIDRSRGDAMLRFQGGSWFHIELPAALPENFAIEFDYYTNEGNAVLFVSAFDAAQSGQSAPSYSGYRQGPFNFFELANTVVGAAIDRGSDALPMANAQNRAFADGVVPVRLEARGRQARIYIDGSQVLIHPAASLLRSDVVEFFYASVGSPGNGYIGNIRILSQ
jgi:hypothetical protein